MLAVSRSTSAGSTAGNIATRSWLRPSLRYGSVSTMPLARRTFEIAEASTDSAKSMVPTTLDRSAGSVTNGVATGLRSAQPYRIDALSAVRLAAQLRPPWASIHSVCSAARKTVASAGVL